MAGTRKAGSLGLEPEIQDLNDGTLARMLSPRPGVINEIAKIRPPKVPDSTAHYNVRKGDSLWKISADQIGSGLFAYNLAKLNRISPEDILQIGQRLIVPNYQRYDLTVTYMLSEMLKNANSVETKAITDAVNRSKQSKNESIKAFEDMKKAEWYELFRIYGDQIIFNSMVRQSGIAMAEAKARWFLQVRQGGPWDHKPILNKMYMAMGTPPRPFGSLSRALHFPIRGDLFHEYYYDIWSNIHYGYIGTKCGFDENTLQGGAASGLPGAGGNDEGDVISVKIGIDLWKSSGLMLSADVLRKAILSHKESYIAARKQEINSGIKAEKATYVVITDNDYK